MLNVTESIKSKVLDEPYFEYKILNLGGNEVYVMGSKKIIKFQAEEIVLKLKNNDILSILGQEMFLKEICKEGVLISGKIKQVGIV